MSKPSLVENALCAIKQDIVRGRLADNQPIKVQELSASYNVGPTPIREALNQLAATGLVVAKLNCGFKVPEFSATHMQHLFELRFLLEPVAIKSSLQHYDQGWEECLVLLRHRVDKADNSMDKVFAERNLYLHLFVNCKSAVMRMAITAAYDCCLRYYYLYAQTHQRNSQSLLLKLIDGLLNATAQQRASLLKRNLRLDEDRLMRGLRF